MYVCVCVLVKTSSTRMDSMHRKVKGCHWCCLGKDSRKMYQVHLFSIKIYKTPPMTQPLEVCVFESQNIGRFWVWTFFVLKILTMPTNVGKFSVVVLCSSKNDQSFSILKLIIISRTNIMHSRDEPGKVLLPYIYIHQNRPKRSQDTLMNLKVKLHIKHSWVCMRRWSLFSYRQNLAKNLTLQIPFIRRKADEKKIWKFGYLQVLGALFFCSKPWQLINGI